MSGLLSIIIPAYNIESYIGRCLDSLLNQTYENIEYIIVDGASKDKTVDIAESYVPLFEKKEGKSLKIISESDKGMYDALNKGANFAHGELVGQINSDDWYELDAVETMVSLYEKEHYEHCLLRVVAVIGNKQPEPGGNNYL